MKKIQTTAAALALLATAATLALATAAQAHGEISCDVPREERKPRVELQKMLKAQGWTVRKLKIYKGCYEVYGFDDKDQPVEAFFHPKTFERLQPK